MKKLNVKPMPIGQLSMIASPSKERRRAQALPSVQSVFANARKKCIDKEGMSIMTEFISIRPLSLEFTRKDVEKEFLKEHKGKYRGRFRPLLIALAAGVVLMALPDMLDHHYKRTGIKVVTAGGILFSSLFAEKIYDNDKALTAFSSMLTYVLLFTRIIMEGTDGNLFLNATERDIGFIFLLFAILGVVIGLRFPTSLTISMIISSVSVACIWNSHDEVDADYRFEATTFVFVGFYFFNMVLLRRMEIQERKDFRLTKRLAAENVHVQMQMENFSLFSKGIAPSQEISSAVAPGGALSIGSRIAAIDLDVRETIGVGSYGDVMIGKYKGTTVAIKKIRNDLKKDSLGEIGSESSLMADMRHPNIVLFMGICLSPPMLVMEYCSRGSVYQAIHVDRINFDWSLLLRILMNAARGMSFLHQHDPPIIHRDLKSLNLLLDENWRCKVSDFGLSTLKKMNLRTDEDTPMGSIPWMAPESATSDKVDEKSDVYGFGIIIFEILKKAMPYENTPMQGIPYIVSQGKRPTDFTDISNVPTTLQSLVGLMKLCWDQSPDNRPEFETIVDIFEQEIVPGYFGDKTMNNACVFPREKGNEPNEQELALTNLKFNVNEKDLVVGLKIGGGSYGAVYAGKWLGTEVAIKQLFITSLPEKVLLEFHKECDLMRQLRHPNIVLFLGSSSKPPNLYLLTELLQKGSLFDIYHHEEHSANLVRHYGLVLKVAKDMARGMAYLHSRSPPLIHRDLKSPNVMVDCYWVSKIGDFGLSRLKDENKTMTKCGSPLWVAPEVLQGHRFGEPCDVYSFAIIVWELMAWSEPYPEMSSKKVMKDVALKGMRPSIPHECPSELRILIGHCWLQKPSERPAFTDIVNQLEYIDTSKSNF